MISLLMVALAVAGVSADHLDSGFRTSGYILTGGFHSSLPVINTHIRTPVVENPPVQLPGFPTSFTDTCHCFKTVLTPQLCNDIYAVPSVDRFVRTVTAPVVETVRFGTNQLPTFTQSDVGTEADRRTSGVFQGNAVNASKPAKLYEEPGGGTFAIYQATHGNVFGKPTFTRTGVSATSRSATFQNPTVFQNNGPTLATY